MQSKHYKIVLIIATLLLPHSGSFAFAQTIDELQSKINSHSEQIKKLDEEIKQYQSQLEETGKQANTLQNTIKTLDTNQKKVTTEIQKTQTNIGKTDLTLDQLTQEIVTTEQKIATGKQAVAISLRELRGTDSISLAEIMLGAGSLTQAFNIYEESQSFNQSVQENSEKLSGYKLDVQDKQSKTQEQKKQLVNLQGDLKNQNATLADNKKEKSNLLTETKNKEAEYQKILAQKQAEKASFQAKLFTLASQLSYKLDPSKLPPTGESVFNWPLDDIFITQQFGKTSDSGRLYTSGTHDGVDFRAALGTPVKAVLSGTVYEINQGAVQNCQYGKWIVIKHPNGLATLYGHLSEIQVAKGQSVSAGQVIGFSGSTGYATGPHLHLTVYAADAVSLKQYTCKSGKTVTIPIAPTNAYLDPLQYLPSL